MKIFLIVIVAILAVGFAILFLVFLTKTRTDWKHFNKKGYSTDSVVRITYKQFYEFYNVNPNAWTPTKDLLIKRIPKTYRTESYYFNGDHNCQVTFSFLDYIKYCEFLAHREEMKAKSKEAEDIARFINSVQEDINNMNDKISKMTVDEEIPPCPPWRDNQTAINAHFAWKERYGK